MNTTPKDTKKTGYTGKKWSVRDNNQNYANTLAQTAESSKWNPTKEVRINPHELAHTDENQFGLAFEQHDVPHRTDLRRISQGGFRYHDVVRNYYDFDNDWVDHHPADYTDDSIHYSQIEMSTPPQTQQLSGTSFPQDDMPHMTEQRRVSTGGFRFSGTVRNTFDYQDTKNKDWMMSTSEHPEFQFRSKSKEFRMPGTLRADFDVLNYDAEQEEEESNAEYDSGFAFLQDDVPHVSSPLLKKVSRGGYRFHGVVRNIYDYDISEEDLAKQIQLHPQYMRRTKSKEYQKPGTTRVGFDTDESSWESSMRGETDSSGETIVQGEDRSATSEDLVIQHIPGISPSTKDTLSYYQGQAKQNASSKWQQPTDISPQSSSYMQGMPKKSTPGVADTLSYFQDKVAPKQQRKKTADVEETLSYFHQKVAPKQPVAGIPSQVKKQEISEQVQGTLLQYQQHGAQQGAVPKLKPTTVTPSASGNPGTSSNRRSIYR